MADEVFPWLKSLPLAPEYHPTITEFQDPIAYIFKIEEEASKYGICKIVPPVSPSPKKTIIANLNRSLSAQNPDSSPTFTTRRQQIGFSPRKHRQKVNKPVWQSGETYTLPQFESKAKTFEKNYFKKRSNSKTGLTELEVETLYWKAQTEKPFLIEYANDISGSAFHRTGGGRGGKKQGKRGIGESEWNLRGVSRAKGCLLKFVKEEIPGVTSPMVYMGMMFSWFAWHVEDHELHSLNYMHMGGGKTWYGVPKDGAVEFEDVIRGDGYGGEVNPIVTFATLGDKTTIMSPDALLKAGVPCCRLVQNAGEFVVTFPRAYHSGFSHGFNCAEAVNIATPGWLRVARDAAIRRASINRTPMVSHSQLLYDLAMSLSTSIKPKPRSSRLKDDNLVSEGEFLVKRLFLQDMMQNNELLHTLGKESPIVLFSEDALDGLTSKDSCFGSRVNASPMLSRGLCIQNALDSLTSNPGLFSCVRCGILCYACVAIIQPTEATARYLISVDRRAITDLVAATDVFTANEDANLVDLKSSSEREMSKSGLEGLFDFPVRIDDQIQVVDDRMNTISATRSPKISSSLDLLALAYGDPSDSEEENDVESDKFFMESNCSTGRFEYQIQVPHSERSKPSNANGSEALITGKAITRVGNKQMNPTRDEDTSRMHVFCLQHAAEVEQCLRVIGGVHMLLLCRQDYPKLEAEARLVAKEFESDHIWANLEFREASKQDREMIQSGLDNEESTHDIHDWAARLGIHLSYSSRLSHSPLYTKQMPYNSVLYKAFGNGISPDQEHDETDVSDFSRMDMKLEKHPQITQVALIKNPRKRKNMTSVPPPPPPPPPPPRDLPMSGGFRRQRTTTPNPRSLLDKNSRKQKVKPRNGTKKAVEGEFGCEIEGCDMSFDSRRDLTAHEKNVCTVKGCGKRLFSHKYLVQHRRVHMDDRPLKCPWKGCRVTFKWAWARTEHIRVHTGARPYTCNAEGCGRTFRFVSDFSRHKRKTGHFVKK